MHKIHRILTSLLHIYPFKRNWILLFHRTTTLFINNSSTMFMLNKQLVFCKTEMRDILRMAMFMKNILKRKEIFEKQKTNRMNWIKQQLHDTIQTYEDKIPISN